MYSALDQRIERINTTCHPSGNLGSFSSDAADNKHGLDICTISLTSCYKHQWKVVFQEQDSESTTDPSQCVTRKTENSSIL
jgi:hypothetical protein